MEYQVCNVKKQDYSDLIEVWEKAVRATHDFLPDEEIDYLRSMILGKYFDCMHLKCVKNIDGKIIAFSGVTDKKLEMLFVLPAAQGKGVGSALCQWAIEYQKATQVDVFEQYPPARKFYQRFGFMVVSRSEFDEEGKPYPILHMEK
jgi:putative acetyltransferase